jgi:hypothetical protein
MRYVVSGLVLLLIVGCGSQDAPQQTPDEQSQRSRDSAIAESGLPGASGVRSALTVADSAASRKALADSLAQDH